MVFNAVDAAFLALPTGKRIMARLTSLDFIKLATASFSKICLALAPFFFYC